MDTSTEVMEAPQEEPRLRLPPFDIILLVAVASLLVFWFLPAFRYYEKQWFARDSYYIHGPLVPIISAILAWQRRHELKGWRPQIAYAGLSLLLLGMIVRLLGDRMDHRFFIGFAFVFVVAGLVWFIGGARLAKFFSFPLFFLFFMCPLPSTVYIPLSVPLQMASTVIAAVAINGVGIQASRMGVIIKTLNAEVMIGQPCSGFRLMITLLAAAFIFSYLMEAPLWRKGVLLVLVVPLALLMNALRVMFLVLVAHFSGMAAMEKVHYPSGYVIVVIACLVFMWLMRLIGCREYKQAA